MRRASGSVSSATCCRFISLLRLLAQPMHEPKPAFVHVTMLFVSAEQLPLVKFCTCSSVCDCFQATVTVVWLVDHSDRRRPSARPVVGQTWKKCRVEFDLGASCTTDATLQRRLRKIWICLLPQKSTLLHALQMLLDLLNIKHRQSTMFTVVIVCMHKLFRVIGTVLERCCVKAWVSINVFVLRRTCACLLECEALNTCTMLKALCRCPGSCEEWFAIVCHCSLGAGCGDYGCDDGISNEYGCCMALKKAF